MSDKTNPEASLPPDILREDPGAKAAYSANPGFTDGAEEAHPIDAIGKSLLARPDISEALEASYIIGLDDEKIGLDNVDLKLAKDGLRWLRKNLDDDSAPNLRRRVIQTKSNVAIEEQAILARAEQTEVQERAEQQRATERQTKNEIRATAEAEKAAAEAEQEARYAEFEQELSRLQAENPNIIPPDGLLSLGKHIEVTAEEGQPKNSFQSALDAQTAEYLLDPDKLADDIFVLAELNRAYPVEEGNTPVVGRYSSLLTHRIDESVAVRHYQAKDLTPEIVNKWLNILVDAHHVKKKEDIVIGEPAQPQGPTVARALEGYGGEILENTIHEVIQQKPDKLVDILHMIAEQGLDPSDEVVRNITMDMIKHWFISQPLSVDIVQAACASGDARIHKKAIDILQTIQRIDPTIADILSQPAKERRAQRMDDEGLKIMLSIYKRYFKVKGRLTPEMHQRFFDQDQKNTQEFLKSVEDGEEAADSTLYARFL